MQLARSISLCIETAFTAWAKASPTRLADDLSLRRLYMQ